MRNTDVTLDTLSADVSIEATYLGRCKGDDKWEHDAWNVSLTFKGRTYQDIAYRMGTGHSAEWLVSDKKKANWGQHPRTWEPTPPAAADLIYSLMMDVSGLDQGFEDWAADFGMDKDSRQAERMYRQCLETLPRLHALLGSDFGQFETAAQNY